MTFDGVLLFVAQDVDPPCDAPRAFLVADVVVGGPPFRSGLDEDIAHSVNMNDESSLAAGAANRSLSQAKRHGLPPICDDIHRDDGSNPIPYV